MMEFSPERVRANVRQATTEDLLDRVTVYRSGMEPAALQSIEAELHERGVGSTDIETHAAKWGSLVLRDSTGVALQCSFCRRPAVVRRWGWQHLLHAEMPLVFPRRFLYCDFHRLRPPPGNRVSRGGT